MELSDRPDPVGWQTIAADPADTRWMHSGMGVLGDGRIVFAEPGGAAVIILDEASGASSRVPTGTADAHGIFVAHSDEGDRLWIADPGPAGEAGQLIEVDLGGTLLSRVTEPGRASDQQAPDAPEGWKPTSSAIVSTADSHDGDLWIADGYGRSLVHVIRADGTTRTFDGTSTTMRFDCPHGIAIDDRRGTPQVVIADRNNRRVVFLDLDGEFLRSVSADVMTSPSSIAVRGDDLLITDLFGALLRIDLDDTVHAVLPSSGDEKRDGWPNRTVAGETVPPLVQDGVLNSPHGIAVSQSGAIYLTEWFLGGRVVRVTV